MMAVSTTIRFLSLAEVIGFHAHALEQWGGSDGLRDRAALDSAVAIPKQGFGESYYHPTLPDMAAAYAFHIAQNQPFVDGNKRTGAFSAIIFLVLNNFVVVGGNEVLPDLMIRLGTDRKKQDLADFFRKQAHPLAFSPSLLTLAGPLIRDENSVRGPSGPETKS